MDKQIICDYYYDFKYYQVLITYKRMRSITYRYDPEKELFKVSAPILTSKKKIFKYLEQFAPKLINKSLKKKPAINADSIFIFGHLYPLVMGKVNKLYPDQVVIKKKDDLNRLLKRILKKYLVDKVPYYEKIMNVAHYQVSVKNMHTRHASNSSYSHRLSFATSLVHYSYPVIDSVIIHELSHDVYFNHSKDFYQFLLKFCPKYKAYKKALDNTDYTYENYQQGETKVS